MADPQYLSRRLAVKAHLIITPEGVSLLDETTDKVTPIPVDLISVKLPDGDVVPWDELLNRAINT